MKSKIFIFGILLIISIAIISIFYSAGRWFAKENDATSVDKIVILMGSISKKGEIISWSIH